MLMTIFMVCYKRSQHLWDKLPDYLATARERACSDIKRELGIITQPPAMWETKMKWQNKMHFVSVCVCVSYRHWSKRGRERAMEGRGPTTARPYRSLPPSLPPIPPPPPSQLMPPRRRCGESDSTRQASPVKKPPRGHP